MTVDTDPSFAGSTRRIYRGPNFAYVGGRPSVPFDQWLSGTTRTGNDLEASLKAIEEEVYYVLRMLDEQDYRTTAAPIHLTVVVDTETPNPVHGPAQPVSLTLYESPADDDGLSRICGVRGATLREAALALIAEISPGRLRFTYTRLHFAVLLAQELELDQDTPDGKTILDMLLDLADLYQESLYERTRSEKTAVELLSRLSPQEAAPAAS